MRAPPEPRQRKAHPVVLGSGNKAPLRAVEAVDGGQKEGRVPIDPYIPEKRRSTDQAQDGNATKQCRQCRPGGPQRSKAHTIGEASSSGSGITGVPSQVGSSASRQGTCVKCAHPSHTYARPSKRERAPNRWCTGRRRTRSVATVTCSVCTHPWPKCQCAETVSWRARRAQEAVGSISTRVQEHTEAAVTDTPEHCMESVWQGLEHVPRATSAEQVGQAVPEGPAPNQRPDPMDLEGKTEACSGVSTAVAEPGSSHAERRAPATEGDPRSPRPNAQQHSSGDRKRQKSHGQFQSSRTEQLERISEESARETAMDDALTLPDNLLGTSRGSKRQRGASEGEGHRDSAARFTRFCISASPAPDGYTRTAANIQNKRPKMHGEVGKAATVSTALLLTPNPGVNSCTEPEDLPVLQIRLPTAGATGSVPDRSNANGRTYREHQGNRTAAPPTPWGGCGAPRQRKRHAHSGRHISEGMRSVRKCAKLSAERTAHARDRLQQQLQATTAGGTVRDASPQEPQPRLQGRGWHDRWPPPAIGGCGRDATVPK